MEPPSYGPIPILSYSPAYVPPEGWGGITVLDEPDSSQTKRVSDYALPSYNEKHGSNYEFVEGFCSNRFFEEGVWYHANFKAKDKSVSGEDSPTKLFFAELKATGQGYDVKACRILDGRKLIAGCHRCRSMLHPTSGFQKGRVVCNMDIVRSHHRDPIPQHRKVQSEPVSGYNPSPPPPNHGKMEPPSNFPIPILSYSPSYVPPEGWVE